MNAREAVEKAYAAAREMKERAATAKAMPGLNIKFTLTPDAFEATAEMLRVVADAYVEADARPKADVRETVKAIMQGNSLLGLVKLWLLVRLDGKWSRESVPARRDDK